MTSRNLNRLRKSKEVLEVLREYGPLTRKTLSLIIPSIKDERNFRRTLAVLSDRKLICKRFENINGGHATIYQLNQNERVRDILSAFLKCSSDELRQREFRYRELYHEQISALLAHHLKELFPDAKVYRDFQLYKDDRIKTILPQLNNVDSAKPDVLVVFWNQKQRVTSVAFEFERTAKSKARLFHKLRSYSAESQLDGVVYIGSSDQIILNLQQVYSTRVLERSLRIKHYGNNFLICASHCGNIQKSLSLCLNAERKILQFNSWINILLSTREEERRNSLFI